MINNDFGLYIVSTPIGNLKDISERAINTIKEVDFIICENPSHSLKLLNNFGIKKKLISLHDHSELKIIKKVEKQLYEKKVALISDAGSPLISDPGYKLTKYCIDNNINVTSIPGANSIIPSLQLSGIPINEFYFAGFFPKSDKKMLDFIEKISNLNITSVFFVSNNKINICLDIIEKKMNERLVSVSKELTKLNEKTYRGDLQDIKKNINSEGEKIKGEFVVVVGNNSNRKIDSPDLIEYEHEILKLLSKFSLTDVVEIVHKLTNISKNKVYKWLLKIKKS